MRPLYRRPEPALDRQPHTDISNGKEFPGEQGSGRGELTLKNPPLSSSFFRACFYQALVDVGWVVPDKSHERAPSAIELRCLPIHSSLDQGPPKDPSAGDHHHQILRLGIGGSSWIAKDYYHRS